MFDPGDRVRLPSGGPVLTVLGPAKWPFGVLCEWQAGKGKRSAEFDGRNLVRIPSR